MRDVSDRIGINFLSALAYNGITIALGKGCFRSTCAPAANFAHDLDCLAEPGAKRVSIVSLDRNRERSREEIARLGAMAAARGMASAIEFVPACPADTLEEGLDAVSTISRAHLAQRPSVGD